LGFSLAMFEHARDHIELYRRWLAVAAASSLLARFARYSPIWCATSLPATADKKSADVIPREFAVQYVVGAFMAVMTWWLDGGAKLPPRRIDAMFRHLATEGIVPSYS